MTRRAPVAVLALLPALVLSGCSSNGKKAAASPAPTSLQIISTTATPRPTPTVHVITPQEAAQHYLKIVAPSNAAGDALGKITASGQYTFAQIRTPLTIYVASLDKFARDLLAYNWPTNAKPIAQRLAAAVLQDRIAFKSPLVQHGDQTAMQVWNATPNTTASNGIATEMRIALGLPSN
jgi:hypothetical protein